MLEEKFKPGDLVKINFEQYRLHNKIAEILHKSPQSAFYDIYRIKVISAGYEIEIQLNKCYFIKLNKELKTFL